MCPLRSESSSEMQAWEFKQGEMMKKENKATWSSYASLERCVKCPIMTTES